MNNTLANLLRRHGLLVILAVAFIVIRVAWSATYPPTRNYDHFNTQTALNVLENPALYSSDPIWGGGGQTDSLGWIFMGFLYGMERIFGDYQQDSVWVGLYALHLVIYLTGAYGLFRWLLTPYSLPWQGLWLPALMAIMSSLPFYLYFSYTNWGINTPYARHFVTMQAGWLFWAVMLVLQHPKPRLWWWGAIGLWIGSTTYWNPVNGLALTLMIPFALLIEALAGRLPWRAWLLVSLIAGGIFAFYYLTSGSNFTEASESAPLTEAELQEIVDSWVDFAGLHFFPWTVSARFAMQTLIALTVGSGLLVLTAAFTTLENLPRWWIIGFMILLLQIPAPSILSKSTLFFLLAGYWLSRYRRIDRWDVFWLSLLCAVNLASLLQAALGYYLFTEHKLLPFASVAFEGYRPIRWAYLILFVMMARWMGDLARLSQREGGNFLALGSISLISGAILAHVGHVGLDDAMIILPRDTTGDLRYSLPFVAILAALLAQLPPKGQVGAFKQVLQISAIPVLGYAAYEMIRHVADFYETIPSTYAIALILLIGFAAWGWSARTEKKWVWLAFIAISLGLVVAPISAYFRAKPNGNLSADFDQAALWAREESENDALFLTYALDPMPFRAESERGVVAWDVLQTFYFLGPRAYLESFGFLEELLRLDPSQPEAFRATLAGWGVDYVLAPKAIGDLPFPAVFDSDDYVIYDLRES